MLLKIFVPVACGIIAATIFAHRSWAAFVYRRPSHHGRSMPLTIGVVSQLVRGDTFAWGQIMAGASARRCRQ